MWQDALEVLMLTIKNSSKLVQPPTSHIPVVDLGIFHQTLPGPTLQFSMDLSDTSDDVRLAQDTNPTSTWRQTSASQVNNYKLVKYAASYFFLASNEGKVINCYKCKWTSSCSL